MFGARRAGDGHARAAGKGDAPVSLQPSPCPCGCPRVPVAVPVSLWLSPCPRGCPRVPAAIPMSPWLSLCPHGCLRVPAPPPAGSPATSPAAGWVSGGSRPWRGGAGGAGITGPCKFGTRQRAAPPSLPVAFKKRESERICIQLIRRPANTANLVQTHFGDKMILTLSN